MSRTVPAFRVAVGDTVVIDRVRCTVRTITPVVRFGTRTRPVPETDRVRLRIEGRPTANPTRPTRSVTVGNYDPIRVPA